MRNIINIEDGMVFENVLLIWKEKVTKLGVNIPFCSWWCQKRRIGFWRHQTQHQEGAICRNKESLGSRAHEKTKRSFNIRFKDQVKEPRLVTPVQDDVHHRKNKYQQGGNLSTKVGGKLNPTWVSG